MTGTAPTPRLPGKRIGILMESDFVEDEITYYRRRFAEEGAEVTLFTRLWGNPALTFTGHEQRAPLEVDGDLESLDIAELARLDALIVPSGMVADRLRYSEHAREEAPAVSVLRRAFRLPGLVKAFSCHGLLLATPAPELLAGRTVTCHNNLIGDVRNMGAAYLDQDLVVDRDLVTGRTVEECHLLARAVIGLLSAPGKAAVR
ncbi:thiamine biosynthesis protein ThiJ [Streptomyces albofaciens JCM 4342]|uniref:DJ-1/PfpI family protein n=1 Tax=Streptomyces albofaciens TaxID=66866 RepID=UPI001238CD5F|nr:DJ-1/PfpI family protein [Streptomyces albofaciens]KAA6212709.1 thiamine biosynthesis protein ThiJ [Streptomyces albofaciens JCM 4342]